MRRNGLPSHNSYWVNNLAAPNYATGEYPLTDTIPGIRPMLPAVGKDNRSLQYPMKDLTPVGLKGLLIPMKDLTPLSHRLGVNPLLLVLLALGGYAAIRFSE